MSDRGVESREPGGPAAWLMDRSSDAILRIDPTGLCVWANASSTRVLGADPRHAIGTTVEALLGIETETIAVAADSGATFDVAIPGGAADPHVGAACRLTDEPDGAAFVVTIQRLPQSPRRLPLDAGARTRAELIDAVQRLTDQNETLERITSLITHDLQAPMRRITSFGQLLGRDLDALPEAAQSNLEYVIRSAAHASRLLADLRAYTRIDATATAVMSTDLERVVAAAIREAGETIAEHDAKVRVDASVVLTTSPELLRRALVELLTNAAVHAGPGANVEVRAVHDYDVVRIEVLDDGPGVAAPFVEQVFDPYRRLHSDSEGHTGMGLAIVRRIADRLSGRVWVGDSDDGARFVLRLPAALPEGPLP